MLKIGNPAKIMFNSEEDLLILLGIQEPDVTVTMFHENSFVNLVPDASPIHAVVHREVKQTVRASALRKPSFNASTLQH